MAIGKAAGVRRLLLAALAALLPLLPSHASGQVPKTGYEQGIFEISARDVPSLVVVAIVDSANRVLLPAQTILQATGFPFRRDSQALVVSRGPDGDVRLDLRSQMLHAGAQTLALKGEDMVVTADEIFLAPEAMGVLLHAEVVVDWSSLVVALRRDQPFPAARLDALRARRTVLLGREHALRAQSAARTRFQPRSGIGILDWDLSTLSLDPREGALGDLRFGAALLGGSLVASERGQLGGLSGTGLRESLFSYERVFPTSSVLRRIGLGDLNTEGLVSRPIRGLTVTNTPENRASEIGEFLIHPDIPADWQYEILQGGRLVGFSDDGRGPAVPVPVQMGATAPIVVHMYGPTGEEITREFVYFTPVSLLPLHRLEYSAAAGSCRTSTCRNFAQGDLRYGLSRLLTLGVGAQRTADTVRSEVLPTAALSFTTGTVLTGEMRYIPGALLDVSLLGHEGDRSMAIISGHVSRPDLGELTVLPDRARQWSLAAGLDRTLRGNGRIQSLRLTASANGLTDAPTQTWNASIFVNHRSGLTQLRYEYWRAQPSLVSAQTSVYLPLRGSGLTPMVSAGLGLGEAGLQTGQAGLAVRARQSAYLSAEVRWNRVQQTPTLNLGFNAIVGSVQSALRATSAKGATVSASMSLSGAAAITSSGQLRHGPFGRVGYAGVRGRVFQDADGDGRFGPGDVPMPHARIVVGETQLETDDGGNFVTWELRPYEVTAIAMDTITSPDPSWITATPEVLVRLTPNTATRVDLPLVQTREASGQIVAAEGVATAAGVTVHLVGLTRGDSISATTFTDGSFYVSRIRPGSYRVSVAPPSLNALEARVKGDGPLITIPAGAGTEIVEVPTITLVPKQ